MRQPIFNYVLNPSMEITRSQMGDFGELGKKRGFLRRFKKLAMAPLTIHRTVEKKLWKATVPKQVRRQFTRRTFIKVAPVLAAVAQILNIIPGLGLAVGAAITAAAMIASKEQARSDRIKARKQTSGQADQSYLSAQQYIETNYDMTYARFQVMPPDQKVAFLSQVSNDQQVSQAAAAQVAAQNVSGLGQTSAGSDPELNALQAEHTQADQLMNTAFDKAQGYFTATYNVSASQFQAMTLDDKMNFMGVAVQDAQADQKASKGPFEVPTTLAQKTSIPAPSAPPASGSKSGSQKSPSAGGGSSSTLMVIGLVLLGLAMFSRKKR